MTTEPRRLGKYELRERLARGGQGEVWKAFDPQLRRYVAIKQLHADMQADPHFISRFEREAQLIAALHHPNIVQIHDFQTVYTPGSPVSTAYMVMDYVEGPTLADYIRNTSRKEQFPSASDIVSIFTSISLALDYAHQKGMIHRDIKPANIMLDRRNPHGKQMGEPILMDFGIAKLQGGADTVKVLGTPLYVSPEQAQGEPGDGRSDLYSLGIILYEITTGVTPFRGDSVMAILLQHFRDMPTPPALINPNIPPELSAVILKSIAKDPDNRFPTASAMTIALAEALNIPVPPELWKSSTTPAVTSEFSADNPLSLSARRAPSPLTPPPSSPLQFDMLASPSAAVSPANGQYAKGAADSGAGKRSRKALLVVAGILLMAVIVGLASSALLLSKKTGPSSSVPVTVVGHMYFLSSQHPPKVFDGVQISSQGIPDAPSGKSYYAWLEIHSEDIAPVSWSLTVHNGSFSPPTLVSPPQHQNLLVPLPYLFLITLQSGSTNIPSFDSSDRLYYALIPPQVGTPQSGTTLQQSASFDIRHCPQSGSNNVCAT